MKSVCKKWCCVLIILSFILGLCFLYPTLSNQVQADAPTAEKPKDEPTAETVYPIPNQIISAKKLENQHVFNNIPYLITSESENCYINEQKISGKYVHSIIYDNKLYLLTKSNYVIYNMSTNKVITQTSSFTGALKLFYDHSSQKVITICKSNNSISIYSNDTLSLDLEYDIAEINYVLPSITANFQFHIIFTDKTNKISVINIFESKFSIKELGNGDFISSSSFLNSNKVHHYILTKNSLLIFDDQFILKHSETLPHSKALPLQDGVLVSNKTFTSKYNQNGKTVDYININFTVYTLSSFGTFLFGQDTLYSLSEEKLITLKTYDKPIIPQAMIATEGVIYVYKQVLNDIYVYYFSIT